MKKVFITLGIFIVIINIYICIYTLVPFLSKNESDYCIEDGDCPKGKVIKIDNKTILIDRQTCIEYDGKWYENIKECHFNFNNYPTH